LPLGLVVGPSPGQTLVIAIAVSVLSWWADRLISFGVQGVTRWAIDSGLAALTIYVAQFLWPGPGVGFTAAVFAGFAIGALEIPLHFYLAKQFGLRRPGDEHDGIR
jgi:hypothetical protein